MEKKKTRCKRVRDDESLLSFLLSKSESLHTRASINHFASIARDASEGLRQAFDIGVSSLGISPTQPELQLMKAIAKLITTRAARLSATGVAAISQKRDIQTCHLGIEGSLFEKHPHFQLELVVEGCW